MLDTTTNKKKTSRVYSACKLAAALFVAVFVLLYFYKWNWHGPLTNDEKLECYGQVIVGDKMIGSGFFLEDISGLKRAYYFVTNAHVRDDAMEFSRASGYPICLRFKSCKSENATVLTLGTDAFTRVGTTDIVSIPIFPPMFNRVLFGAGYRFVALDRDFIKGKKTNPSKGRMYLVSSRNYSDLGIASNATTLTYHHFPEPNFAARKLELWTNTVCQAQGHILSMPSWGKPFSNYQFTPLFKLFSPVFPGDSGSLVTHEEDGISYGFAVIEGMRMHNGQQAGPAIAIISDVVIDSLPEPTFAKTFKGIIRAILPLLVAYVLILLLLLVLSALVMRLLPRKATEEDSVQNK